MVKAYTISESIDAFFERGPIPFGPLMSPIGSAAAGAFFGGLVGSSAQKQKNRKKDQQKRLPYRKSVTHLHASNREHQQAIKYWERVIRNNPKATSSQKKYWQRMLAQHRRLLSRNK